MTSSVPSPFAPVVAPNVHPLGSTASLLDRFRIQGRLAGVSAATVMIQSFMEALGLAGGRLSWKRSQGGAPSFARVSMTAVGTEAACPSWMLDNLSFPREQQVQVRRTVQSWVLPQATPQEYRIAREKQRMLRSWARETAPPLRPPLPRKALESFEFLIEIQEAAKVSKASPRVFGADRMLILEDKAGYRRLLGTRSGSPALWEAAANQGNGLRVSLHGWIDAGAIVPLLRNLGPDLSERLGWLLPVGDPEPVADGGQVPPDFHRHFLFRFLGLRLGKQAECFRVTRWMEEWLDEAVSAMEHLVAAQPEHLRRLCEPATLLPWHYATLLQFYARKPGSDDILEPAGFQTLLKLALAAAERTLSGHANILRQAFPAKDLADPFFPAIMDRLTQRPRELRELVRSFHKVQTGEIKGRLELLAGQGLVSRREDGKWHPVLLPLSDLSAEMAAISEMAS